MFRRQTGGWRARVIVPEMIQSNTSGSQIRIQNRKPPARPCTPRFFTAPIFSRLESITNMAYGHWVNAHDAFRDSETGAHSRSRALLFIGELL